MKFLIENDFKTVVNYIDKINKKEPDFLWLDDVFT
jgi:hypothetical protein